MSWHYLRERGGGILGGHLLGWECVCAVEINKYARAVLFARQRDGVLPRFPVWDDITTFPTEECPENIQIITGGFPCQDISAAGKGAGITGARSGLWTHMARVINDIRPRYVFVENSPRLVSRGLETVLSSFAQMGYNAEWGVIGAQHAKGVHRRNRIWILAYTRPPSHGEYVGECAKQNKGCATIQIAQDGPPEIRCKDWFQLVLDGGGVAPTQWRAAGYTSNPRPLLLRNDNGLAHGLDRLGAVGNGQVPVVVKLAWLTLYRRIYEKHNNN